jgi:hypothetical protein
LLASIFKNINNRIVKPHNPELHKRKKVTPIVGKIPITIAMFTKKCVNKIPATQYP